MIENGNVSPSLSKIRAVKNFSVPKSKRANQSFLGLTGYFRKFIRDYARICETTVWTVLKNDQSFRFGAEEERSFEQLKQLLTREPILRIYRPNAITELHTDASKEGYGAERWRRKLFPHCLFYGAVKHQIPRRSCIHTSSSSCCNTSNKEILRLPVWDKVQVGDRLFSPTEDIEQDRHLLLRSQDRS